MIRFLRRKLNPSCYQGSVRRSNHFEGWYYRITDRKKENPMVIIPCVVNHQDKKSSHAFIQVFDGGVNKTVYQSYPIKDFTYREGVFDIRIGGSRFSKDCLELDVKTPSDELHGSLKFTGLKPWPGSLVSPGIMGWYTWMPRMECYHGIVSMNHRVEGALNAGGRSIDFTNGRGYTEKDWGRSFPAAYIWCQSNHFTDENTCLTGSIAVIPWISKPFLGLIFGLSCMGKLFRFATYLGARVTQLEMDESSASWIVQQKDHELRISAEIASGGLLHFPVFNGKDQQVTESLNSKLHVKLFHSAGGEKTLVFQDSGRFAGFETSGNLDRLIWMVEKTGR